jgi:HEAT repeat protein
VCPLVNGDAAAASVRIQAAYVLAWFPEQAAATLPALRLAVEDADPAVAATVLVAIGLVGASDEAELAGPMLGDPRATVRWAAAVALASLLGSAAPPGVAEELIAWSDGPHERHSAIPFFRGFLGSYAGRAWAQLAPPRRR